MVSPSPSIRPSQPTGIFTGLQPGGYTIKVTDACGKTATNTVTVAQIVTNSTIAIALTGLQPSCASTPTGTVTLVLSGTVPPYTSALVASSPLVVPAQGSVIANAISSNFYSTFSNLPAGVYTTEVTDGCGKTRRATFTIAVSTAPTVLASVSPSCPLGATGTINAIATAGGFSGAGSPGAFQFALIAPSTITRPFQSSSVFENLLPGNYTLATKDACGNIGSGTATILAAAAPTFGAAFTTPSCPNSATGTVEAQIATIGGGSPFTFELISPSPITRAAQASNTFTGLPPGAYTIRLRDVCGVPVTSTFTITAAAAPSFTTALTTSCATPASGTILVSPGATAIRPFNFELIAPGGAVRPIQGSNIANTVNSIFTGLNQGNYTLRMTDGCNVPVTNTVTIAAPVALTFPTGTLATASCAGTPTGMLTVATPTNGLGAYKYELIAPSPLVVAPQYSRQFNNLPVGSYTIRITDSCGNAVTIAAPIAVPTATAPTLLVTNTASCATNTGTITALSTTANQGGGAYQYALIAPSPTLRPNQTAPIFTGLSAGVYTVQITDQCGLTGTTTTTIAVAGAFTPAAGGSVVSCAGSSYNGQILVTNPQNFTAGGPIPAGSGGGPYTYAVYDAANTTLIAGPQASNVFSTIAPIPTITPTHTIRVTDICGNTSTVALTLNTPVALANAAITATSASCAASNTGVIKVTTAATGGLAPYTYTLIDATTAAVVQGPQTATTFNEVPANATGYFVRTTDACGNTITTTTALLFPATVTPTVTAVTVPSCASSATGRVTATPGTGATLAGGTFSYSLYDAANAVLIAGPQASPIFNNVAAATYTVRITDRCGTVGTVAATVSSTITALTAAGAAAGTCASSSNGTITGSFTGGSLPITYTLVDQVSGTVIAGPQANNIFNGLAAGTYIVRTIDACGTVANSANVIIATLVAAPSITTSVALDCAGTAIIGGFGAGGSGGPYTYAICTGAACTSFGPYTSTNTFTVTTSATYRISVLDRCGNAVSSGDIVVNIPAKPSITSITKANTCGSTTITVATTGIVNTPYYSVNGSNFSATLPTILPGCNKIKVANFNGGVFSCASDDFELSVYDLPTLAAPSLAQVNCANGNVSIPTSGGNIACALPVATLGVKLISCIGCTPAALAANPIGTIKPTPTPTFILYGATNATFAPTVSVGGTEICAGANLPINFVSTYCPIALPVKIAYFTGNKLENAHQLNWKVLPINTTNATLNLEHSIDGVNFKIIYTLAATAAQMEQPFNFIYNKPVGGNNYYRIKITDDNGILTNSNVVTLSNKTKGFEILSITPNPVVDGKFVINISSFEKMRVEFIITDMAGRLIAKQQANIISGINTIPVKVTGLSNGIYQIIGIVNGEKTKPLSFVKL